MHPESKLGFGKGLGNGGRVREVGERPERTQKQ
jgi:hypothetical protein